MGHPDHDLLTAVGGRELDQLVEHRHRHVEPLDRELVLAEVGLVHEALQRVDLDQALEQREPLVGGERLAERPGLDLLAQPHALAVGGDVLDLVGDRPAVGLAQVRQGVGEGRSGHPHAQDLGGDQGHQFGGQPQRLGVERRVALGLGAERVQARSEVAVSAERLQQGGGGLHGLQQLFVGGAARGCAAARLLDGGRGRSGRRRRRGHGWRRAELDAQRGEDAVVETELALQVLLDAPQEAARLRPLDDAVVVGGGHRHDLLRSQHRADGGEAHGVTDRAGRDDRPLTAHQPRDRGGGAEAPGVGESEVRAHEVLGGERARACPLHQHVVGGEEALEGQAGGVADHRNQQRAGAVALLDVHREAEVDLPVAHAVGAAVEGGVVVGHHRLVGCGARDRVGDEVGERDLAPRRLELAPAGVEGGDGERAEARGGGDRERLLHVAGERRGAAPHQLRPLGRRGGARALGRRRATCRRATVTGRGAQHVGLDDAPCGAATGDVREVHALSSCCARGHRRDPHAVGRRGRGRLPVGLDAVARGRLPVGLNSRCRRARAAQLAAASVEPSAPTAIRAMTWPTVTVSPSSTRSSVTVPVAGEGRSTLILSVAISTMISSRAIASPTLKCHSTISPSVTDSPAAGVTTSIVCPVVVDAAISRLTLARRVGGSSREPVPSPGLHTA